MTLATKEATRSYYIYTEYYSEHIDNAYKNLNVPIDEYIANLIVYFKKLDN